MALAGGASRRLGGAPKGLELVGGRRILDRVVSALGGVSSEILIAANDADADRWLSGVAVVTDRHPGTGGLAGVEAALHAAPGRDILVVAWDMPFVTHEVLREIVKTAREAAAAVCVPESDSPYGIEPFCAFYSARVLPPLTAYLHSGGGPARDFLFERVQATRIPLADVARFGEPQRLFFSVNTPDDLEKARAMAGDPG